MFFKHFFFIKQPAFLGFLIIFLDFFEPFEVQRRFVDFRDKLYFSVVFFCRKVVPFITRSYFSSIF